MAEPRRRYLRPGLLIPVGEQVWVVDEVQPVAVVLDAHTGALVRTVAWPQVPPPAQESWRGSWQVRAATVGLWVQQPGGPLALIAEGGLRTGHVTAGLTLGAVSRHGAWCLPDPPAQDIAASEDAPPAGGGGVHQLLVAHPERTTASVYVDSPVHAARSHDGDLYLRVETGGWSRRNIGPASWDLEPVTAWLRLPADQPLPTQLSLTTHSSDAPPGGQHAEHDGGRRDTSPWLQLPGSQSFFSLGPWAADSELPGGLTWYAGWDCGSRGRDVVAVAWDVVRDTELGRVSLGPGAIRAMTATAGSLWLAIEGPRHFATYSHPAPTRLLRMRSDGRTAETVLPPGTVDITERCWPLPSEPIDAADYTAFWRDKFADLEHYWTRPDGQREPLTHGLSDSAVQVVGSWPDTELHITFAYAPRPGHRLRRTVPLFDELGRQAAPEYAAIHIMEALDTRDIPDGAAPGAEYLDI